MRSVLIIFLLFFYSFSVSFGQKKVIFRASDGLPVTADFYSGSPQDPFMLLFHQENSSRGEFREIAPRLVKLGYNCLAVDLRYGGEMNFVINATVKSADSAGIAPTMYDCRKDIEGAIEYALQKSYQPVVLLGSSFSASLVLLAGKIHPGVKAVLAFSPGEFFLPEISVKDSLTQYAKPVFVAGTKTEYPYIVELTGNIPDTYKRLYAPGDMEGKHGAPALWKSDPAFKEYWLAVIMFARGIMQQ